MRVNKTNQTTFGMQTVIPMTKGVKIPKLITYATDEISAKLPENTICLVGKNALNRYKVLTAVTRGDSAYITGGAQGFALKKDGLLTLVDIAVTRLKKALSDVGAKEPKNLMGTPRRRLEMLYNQAPIDTLRIREANEGVDISTEVYLDIPQNPITAEIFKHYI